MWTTCSNSELGITKVLCLSLLLGIAGSAAEAQVTRSAEKILAEGDTPTWAPGVVTLVNTPFTGPNGEVGFTGTITPAGGPARTFVFREGFTPFFADSALPGNLLTGQETTMGIGSNGGFIYSPSVNGGDGVWGSGGLIAASPQAVPSLAGKFFSFASRPAMFGETGYAFIAGFSNTAGGTTSDRALVRGDLNASGLTIVYKTGDTVAGEVLRFATPNMSFNYDYSDNGEHLMHIIGVGTGTSGNSWVYRDGAWLARPGDPLTGSPYTTVAFNTFSGVSINDVGEWVIYGVSSNFDDTAASNFVAFNGVDALHRTNVVDGITLTSGVVRGASVNNLGEVAHAWSYGSGSPTPKVLFVGPGAALETSTAIVAKGDLVDINNDSIGDFRVYDMPDSSVVSPVLDLSDDGSVTTRLTLEPLLGGTRFDAVLRFCYRCSQPCPSCAADYDQSGGVDGGDVEAFFIDWSNSRSCADVDVSGGVDGSDVEAFFIVWTAGGC